MPPTPPNLPSIFLSHSSVDKSLVALVSRQLGRFGALPWMDADALVAGADLHRALPLAIRQCRLTAVFLSDAAIASRWVDDELAVALRAEDESLHRVVPVFLGEALTLVKSHRRLSARWLHPERDQLTRLSVFADARDPRAIAEALARAAFDRLSWPPEATAGIILDQRGESGRRVGPPSSETVHPRFLSGEGPALLFRPDDGPRTPGATLTGEDWASWWSDVRWGLTELRHRAPGGLSALRLAGAAQLGLGWALGRALDRTSRVEITAFPRPQGPGSLVSNRGQDFVSPLQGGDPACYVVAPELGLPPLPSGTLDEVDLILAPEIPRYLASVQAFRSCESAPPAVLWIRTGQIEDSASAMSLVRDVVAAVGALAGHRGTRHIRVFTALPFHVLPLISANLKHAVQRMTFMEYHRSAADLGAAPSELYVPLEM